MIFDIGEIEKRIEYNFNNKMLLRQCFTHSSYANEHNTKSNERLEFFGDAIIKFIQTEYLYKQFGGDEGSLTKARQGMECAKFFLNTVKTLGLDDFVLLGNGQRKVKGHTEKLYSNLYEALVAGIYLDGGMAKAKEFVANTVIAEFEKEEKKKNNPPKEDYKSALLEFVAKNKIGEVTYETLEKNGPDHAPEYKVAMYLNGKRYAEGKGKSKKCAEMDASKVALSKLKK